MRIMALIPARTGSKRLPGKNIRPLNGKPLILWSLDAVKDVAGISEIVISTDDPDISEICTNAGYQVPWLRPKELATDFTSSVDVALHAIEMSEKSGNAVDALLLLQPTSPFRSISVIPSAIELFLTNNFQPLVSVSRCNSHPMWSIKIEKGSQSSLFL